MPVQNPSKALLSFEVHLLDEPVQSLRAKRQEGQEGEALSMTNVHLTRLARTQHRISFLLQ